MDILRKLFFKDCMHEHIIYSERKITEHRCDCCHKVLFSNDEGDFRIVDNESNVKSHSKDLVMDVINESR